jgi:ABC-type proline/glycine betaine transport system permease subunit
VSLVAAAQTPRLHLGALFEAIVDWMTANLGFFLDAIGLVVDQAVSYLAAFFAAPVIVVLAVIFGGFALAWRGWKVGLAAFVGSLALGYAAAAAHVAPQHVLALTFGIIGLALRGWAFGSFAFLAFLLIDAMGLWDPAMQTLALVLVASACAVALAVPLGIAAARYDVVSRVLRPVMDFMQTMPAFVYLIPAIFLWGVGTAPGAVATLIFAMAPGVRLTELGIRQVDPEVVEAGEAFGASPAKVLFRIQLPLALPTLMAGINQVIMLALSMVVIAGLVGAGGLGDSVYSAISRVQIGPGFEAGLAVVILAIYLDRLTAALTSRSAVVRAQAAAAR